MGVVEKLERTRRTIALLAEHPESPPSSDLIRELEETLEELEVVTQELISRNEELAGGRFEIARGHEPDRRLFDLSHHAQVLTDEQGVIREVSRRAADLLGAAPAWLSGKPLVVFIEPRDRSRYRAAIEALRRGDPVAEHGIRLRPPGANPIAMRLTASREDGDAIHYRWTFAGPEADRDRDGPQAVADERWKSEQLRTLLDLNRTLLTSIGHDLSNALGSLTGLIDTLLDNEHRLSQADHAVLLDRIRRNAHGLGEMLNRVLDRARRVGADPDAVIDLFQVAREVVARIDPGTHPITVEEGSASIHGDGVLVERILENLLGNAFKHTPAGTPIWVRSLLTETERVLIVEDAGPGLPLGYGDRVFRAASDGRPGGLGLRLVGKLAQLMGGRAWVTERTGGGAAFHVSFPAPETETA